MFTVFAMLISSNQTNKLTHEPLLQLLSDRLLLVDKTQNYFSLENFTKFIPR